MIWFKAFKYDTVFRIMNSSSYNALTLSFLLFNNNAWQSFKKKKTQIEQVVSMVRVT